MNKIMLYIFVKTHYETSQYAIYLKFFMRKNPKKREGPPVPCNRRPGKSRKRILRTYGLEKPNPARIFWPSSLSTKSTNLAPSAAFLPVLATAMG